MGGGARGRPGHTPPTKRLLTNRNGRARRRFYLYTRSPLVYPLGGARSYTRTPAAAHGSRRSNPTHPPPPRPITHRHDVAGLILYVLQHYSHVSVRAVFPHLPPPFLESYYPSRPTSSYASAAPVVRLYIIIIMKYNNNNNNNERYRRPNLWRPHLRVASATAVAERHIIILIFCV